MNLMIRSFGVVVLCACTGGGGTITDVPDIERPPTTFERPNERARTGTTSQNGDDDKSSAPEVANTLDCSGTYTCREATSTTPSTISLNETSGQCRFETFVLERDNRVTSGGSAIGTWTVTGSGLTINAAGRTLTCTK
jgi:hypothetical protein